MVGDSSAGIILTSPDGVIWTEQSPPIRIGIGLRDVVCDGSVLVVVGTSGTIQTSP